MKIIFLDIDGVLNHHGTEDRVDGYTGLCSERIARLNQITNVHPDAKIVISSTWRQGMPRAFKAMNDEPQGFPNFLKARGVQADIIGHTRISFGRRRRGDEIREWVEENNPAVFVIIDDDDSGMEGFADYGMAPERDLTPNLVKTDWVSSPDDEDQGGLMDSHVAQAIAILHRTSK